MILTDLFQAGIRSVILWHGVLQNCALYRGMARCMKARCGAVGH